MTSPATTTRKRSKRTAEAEAPATDMPPPAAMAPETEAPAAEDVPSDDDAPETPESRAVAAQQASRALTIPGISATFSERSLTLPEKLTLKGWLKVVEAIDTVREGARWWFGDAIHQGETRWGETYAQALDAGKYDYGTLRLLHSVAKRYPAAERIYDLSWSHYRAAMGVPLDVARELLTEAAANDWSVVQVSARVKEIKSERATDGGEAAPAATNGKGPVPGMAQPRPEDLPGIKPATPDEITALQNAGKVVYDCGGCGNLFAEHVWHCVGCGGHWPLSLDECPNEACGADLPVADATTPDPAPTPAARTVTGTVVTATESGADQALTVLMSFPFADLDPSDIAASLLTSDAYADPLASAMRLHNWLSSVIEAMAADDDEPEAPGRDDEEEAEEAEDDDAPEDGEDGLGNLFGESEDDENEDESDETDEEAAEGTDASESTVAASEDAPAPAARPRATATAAPRPITPAPKPGTGKPVRRRAAVSS